MKRVSPNKSFTGPVAVDIVDITDFLIFQVQLLSGSACFKEGLKVGFFVKGMSPDFIQNSGKSGSIVHRQEEQDTKWHKIYISGKGKDRTYYTKTNQYSRVKQRDDAKFSA